MFPFEDFFHRGNNKMWKVSMGEIRWTGRVGHTLVLVMNTQRGAGRCARKSPTMKWANLLHLQQKFTKAKHNLSQQNSSGYTDTDGFLEHSPRKKPVLKRLPSRRSFRFWGGGPSLICVHPSVVLVRTLRKNQITNRLSMKETLLS